MVKKTTKELMNSTFVKNVLIMITGTAAAQLITMLLSPIITRLYGPEAFGTLGLFMGIIAVITPIASLTYPIGIVLPKEDNDAKMLSYISILISLIMATTLLIILLLFDNKITQIFNIGEIGKLLYFIPLYIIFVSFKQITEQWLIRIKKFGVNARTTFFQALIMQSGKIGFGFVWPTATILIIWTVMGELIKTILALFVAKKHDAFKLKQQFEKPKFKDIKKIAKIYNDFPIYRAPQAFLHSLSQNLPVMFITAFYGTASAGFFALSKSVMAKPAELIGKSFGDVFYPSISEAANKGEKITILILKSVIGLTLIGLIPFGTIILFGPNIFGVIFGEEWIMAGVYARWLSLMLYFVFIYQPCIKSFPILRIQSFHLKYTFLSALFQLLGLYIANIIYNDEVKAILSYSIISCIFSVFLIIFTLKISRKFDLNVRINQTSYRN